jgi:hypothetical protein
VCAGDARGVDGGALLPSCAVTGLVVAFRRRRAPGRCRWPGVPEGGQTEARTDGGRQELSRPGRGGASAPRMARHSHPSVADRRSCRLAERDPFMHVRALLLPVAGDARVVRLPGRDELERLHTIYDLIGCRYAEEVPLAADVTMWLDEEATLRPGPTEPSPPVMLIGAVALCATAPAVRSAAASR